MSDKAKDLAADQAGPGQPGGADSSGAPVSGTSELSADPGVNPEVEIEVEGAAAPSSAQLLAEADAKQKETHDRLLRALADNENFKRRMKKELDDARTDASGRILREMLPVVDNLERALAHAEKQQSGDVGGIVEGVRLVLRQFAQAFERCGVTAIDARGKPFDPNLHEAVSQQESSEQPPGTIIEVLQTGYKIGDRLLRPTLSVVSRAPAAPPPAPAEPAAPAPAEPEGEPAATPSGDTGSAES
jgi:molecular chaperone GrpE